MKLRNFALAALLAAGIAAHGAAPKYIFYFIGDGMGPGPVMAAQNYLRLGKGSNELLTMLQFPVASHAQTWSASSPVTDSAAAGTALATGSKTRNGMLGMNADTVSVSSIARILKDEGYGVGLVTNCAADDATPGAFYAHVPNRSMYYEIGKDAATSGYDFISGAGLRGTKDKSGKPNDLLEVIEQNGVKLLRGAAGAKEVYTTDSKKIMLINPDNYCDANEMGFVIDGVGADSVGLTLGMATEACLYHLQKNSPDRFFMMVEGGLIDHSLHSNDGATTVLEVLDFDSALRVAYNVYLAHPEETLIVVTADHDTGGMTNGTRATGYWASYDYIDSQKMSKSAFSDYCTGLLRSRMAITWEDMFATLSENFGFGNTVKLKDSQIEELHRAFDKTFVDRTAVDEKGLYKESNAFAAEVYRVYNDATGFGFTTPNHTGNLVPVFAIGAGAERFTRLLNNIEIPQTILSLTR